MAPIPGVRGLRPPDLDIDNNTKEAPMTFSELPLSPLLPHVLLDRFEDAIHEGQRDHAAVRVRFAEPRTPEGRMDFGAWHALMREHRTPEEQQRADARVELRRSLMVRMGEPW